jgi:5-methyltetrahydrofolate--homocysteine methyltransferase
MSVAPPSKPRSGEAGDAPSRTALLEAALDDRVLCLDGAMGTALQSRDLNAADFGGEAFEGCNEHLNLTRPDVVESIHQSYLDAGADIIETNTFGSTSLVLAEYPPLQEKAYEITRAAAEIAKRAALASSTPDRPRFVAGAMGPTTKAISVTGGVTFEQLIETFGGQARALLDGGADYLLVETCQDTRNVKAALLGIDKAFAEAGHAIPVAVSGTIEPMGTMLAGQAVDALTVSLEHRKLLYLGLNCATGPELMTDHLRILSELAKTRVACVPNAGLPDEDGRYLETPDMVAHVVSRFLAEGWLNLVGGCCGTRAEHVAALAAAAMKVRPRKVPSYTRTLVSGVEMLEIDEDKRPVLVGERTNSLGSRLFKDLIAAEKHEEASEIARRQVGSGAQVIDVCLQNPDRDEVADMQRFLDFVVKKVKVPLMIDSTDAAVVELALSYCQGKAIINSINLEDGLERFEKVVPMARKRGAAFVVGCIDDNKQAGMGVTRARKLEIAFRSHGILTKDFGVPAEDIIFDPLVFPCATGDVNYVGSALETIEGIRLIKAALPACKTVLGISNVSFGLPPSGREVLNSVFLYHCTKAGLDMAIVNSEKLERYPEISDVEKKLAEDVLFRSSENTIAAFATHFRAKKPKAKDDGKSLPLDQRLARYIVTGSKDGLADDLNLKLKEARPLDIINGPLMAGMDEVGRLFGKNELIVAEVLQSAEAMKAAVAHLEPFMEKADASVKGKLILATVKGDVHDIGKNLVEIILSNNGYKVINLGIKVPPHDLIRAIEEHKPDMIGLSGLLVKSAQQMVITAEELSQHGECPPMLIGGAALTRNFTRKRIAPRYKNLVAYARDAMSGLELAGRIMTERDRLVKELDAEAEALAAVKPSVVEAVVQNEPAPCPVSAVAEVPAPPDFDRHVLKHLSLDEVWGYINPKMLFGKHLGLKGNVGELLERGDEKALAIKKTVDEMKALSRPAPKGEGRMSARAVWRFFPAAKDKDAIVLFDPLHRVRELARFDLPRQAAGERLCLADYVRPLSPSGEPTDALALFVTTAGEGIRAIYEAYKKDGEYLYSHVIQALAVETAEAAAEWLHKKLRAQWGFPDPATASMNDLFQAHYHGKRYSFGYPACPDLALQAKLFALLDPQEIGVTLTDEFMMDPEASVSAIVLHHPEVKYFSAGKDYLA